MFECAHLVDFHDTSPRGNTAALQTSQFYGYFYDWRVKTSDWPLIGRTFL